MNTLRPGTQPVCQVQKEERGGLSLVMPAWNEQDTIRQSLLEAVAALSQILVKYEIIVVDDGSTDLTAEIVRTVAAENPRVRLVQHPRHLGYGAALRTGFQAGALELVAITDADCQFDLSDLEYMLPLIRRFDIVCGYRVNRQDPAHRRYVSWGYNRLVTVLMGTPIRDINCALKIFRREQIPALLSECNNFFVNTEMMTKANQQGLAVVEVGVHHRPRLAGKSKVSLLDIPRTLSVLLLYWWSRVLFPGRCSISAGSRAWFLAGFLVLAGIAGGLLFPNLSYPLLEPDEGRYAEIGREMLTRGDWIVPTLNNEPYYDKPPLFYWLLASSFRLFGTTAAAARLVPALAAFLTIIVTFVFGRRIVGLKASFLAALVLTLMAGFIQCGRILIIDSVLTLFVAISFFTAFEFVMCGRGRWLWWITSAVFCGLGVLTKGPVAFVLLAPPLVAYTWLNRDGARIKLIHWIPFVGLVFCITAPWYIAVSAREPDFGYTFFIENHLQRFLIEGYHERPMWFYFPVLLIGFLPGSLLLFPFSKYLLSRNREVGLLRSKEMGFFLLWAVWCMVFFSISRGKLPPYLIPMAPALAILLGSYLDQAFKTSSAAFFIPERSTVPQLCVVVLSGVWLLATTVAWFMHLIGLMEFIIELGLGTACIIGMALWGRKLPSLVGWTAFCILGSIIIFESAHDLVPAWSFRRSPLYQSEEVTRLLQDGQIPVICYGQEWGSIPFYLTHENYRNFNGQPRETVQEFLSIYPRFLLLVRHNEAEQAFEWAVPPGMVINKILEAGVARVALVEDMIDPDYGAIPVSSWRILSPIFHQELSSPGFRVTLGGEGDGNVVSKFRSMEDR